MTTENGRDEPHFPRFAALGDGVPSHIEIGVPHGGRAAEFFGVLFGWPVHAMGKDNHWAQTPTGAIGIHPGDNDRNMVVYFAVADIEAAARRVRELGGDAPEPGGAEPGFGRMVECRDPQGVRFGLHQLPR